MTREECLLDQCKGLDYEEDWCRFEDERMENYRKYRGKCREMSEELVLEDRSLRLVKGWYVCPIWGKQAHWWTVRQDGTIVDPTVAQFLSNGAGEYVEYDGTVECAQCGRKMREEDATFYGRYAFCKNTDCLSRFLF
jgi:hypothetical protein